MMSEGVDTFFYLLIWMTFFLMRQVHKLNLICHINHSAKIEEHSKSSGQPPTLLVEDTLQSLDLFSMQKSSSNGI